MVGGTCSPTQPHDVIVSVVTRWLPGGPNERRPLKGGGKWIESFGGGRGRFAKPGADRVGSPVQRTPRCSTSTRAENAVSFHVLFRGSQVLSLCPAGHVRLSRVSRTKGESNGVSPSFHLPGDLSLALGPLAEGELNVCTPELCTPGWGHFS